MTNDENTVPPFQVPAPGKRTKSPLISCNAVKKAIPKAKMSVSKVQDPPVSMRETKVPYPASFISAKREACGFYHLGVISHMSGPLLDDSALLDFSPLEHLKGLVNVKSAGVLANEWGYPGDLGFDEAELQYLANAEAFVLSSDEEAQ